MCCLLRSFDFSPCSNPPFPFPICSIPFSIVQFAACSAFIINILRWIYCNFESKHGQVVTLLIIAYKLVDGCSHRLDQFLW